MLILRGQNQRFETLIQNADPKRRSREYCLCFPRNKTISWACTAHCSNFRAQVLLRHLNVVTVAIPNHVLLYRKRTFLGCVHILRIETLIQNADPKRFTGVLFMLPSRRRRFRDHALRIVRGYCSKVNRKAFIWRHLNVVIILLHASTSWISVVAITTIVNAHFWAFWISVLKRRLFENKHTQQRTTFDDFSLKS